MKKILMVLTSHDRLGDTGHKTGFWLEELAAPYYECLDAGAAVRLASPAGGQPPLDPRSDEPDAQTEATRRFRNDPAALQQLSDTHRLAEMRVEDFDAIFFPGGHGPLWDLANNADAVALIEAAIAAGKPVGAVCHAPAVLRDVKDTDGEPLVKGRTVTGFTNSEEEAVGLTHIVPFLVEDMLIERGGNFTRGVDWAPFAVVDGLLITGQNPASSALVAQKLLAALG